VTVEGKAKFKQRPDVHELSQSFATAITFGKIQKERHDHMHGFPVIRIHLKGYDIIVYSPEFDLLLISYLGWTRKALLILWIVLHYILFPITCTCLDPCRRSAQVRMIVGSGDTRICVG